MGFNMKKTIIRLLTMILVTLIVIACGNKADYSCTNFPKWYLANIESKKKIDSAESIKMISQFIRKDSKCFYALQARARLLILMDKLDSAKTDYMSLLSIDNSDVFTLYNIGLILKDQNLYDSSIYYLSKALQPKMNGNVIVEFNKGLDKSNRGQFDVSANEIIYQLGLSYYYAQDKENARKCFSYCVEQHYQAGLSYLYLGAMFVEEGKIKQACDYLEKSKFYGNKDAVNYIIKYCRLGG